MLTSDARWRRRDSESFYEINAAFKGKQLRELAAFFKLGSISSVEKPERTSQSPGPTQRRHSSSLACVSPLSGWCRWHLLFDARPAWRQSPLHTSPGQSLPGKQKTPFQGSQLASGWRTSPLVLPGRRLCSVVAHPSHLTLLLLLPKLYTLDHLWLWELLSLGHPAVMKLSGKKVRRESRALKSLWLQWAPHGLRRDFVFFRIYFSIFCSRGENVRCPYFLHLLYFR